MIGIIQNPKGTILLLGEMEGGSKGMPKRGEGGGRGGEREEEREEEEHPVSLMGFVWGGLFD